MLGVTRNATSEEIKAAYRRRAKDSHPDAYPGVRSPMEHVKKFQQIAHAYEILRDEGKRRSYDGKRFGMDTKNSSSGTLLKAALAGVSLSFLVIIVKGQPREKTLDRRQEGDRQWKGLTQDKEELRQKKTGQWRIKPEGQEEEAWLEKNRGNVVYTPKRVLNTSTGVVTRSALVTVMSGKYETRQMKVERVDKDLQKSSPEACSHWNTIDL